MVAAYWSGFRPGWGKGGCGGCVCWRITVRSVPGATGRRGRSRRSGIAGSALCGQPQALAVRDGWPWLQGRLELAPERERIEAGWWDAAGWARRDYFVARAASGERLWVFRELEGERRWFVHGIFC